MQLPVEYMIKMSLCIALTYLFYALFLKRITHYIWNRLFLLTGTILAFVVPAININLFIEPEKLSGIYFVSKIPAINATGFTTGATTNNAYSFNWGIIVWAVFLLGVGVLAARLLIQVLSLKKIQAGAQLISNGSDDIKLYHLNAGIAPFSFNKSIYVNKDSYNQYELEKVIKHELVHVNQKHSLDVLIAEFLCIVNWYNPFAWLVKNAIKENLEFIADDSVLQNGTNRKEYQYLLLKVTGSMPSAITNNLNFSSLKKRIEMMNSAKTSRAHLFKFLFIVPALSILLLAFRHAYDKPTYHHHTEATVPADNYILETLTYSINDPVIENLVKKDAQNSFLKPGDTLSLAKLKDEKERLADLLQKHGYSNLAAHAITFEVDTTLGNQHFSVQININMDHKKTAAHNAAAVSPKAQVTGFIENSSFNQPAFIAKSTINVAVYINNNSNA